jgi:TolA-binding protein
VRVICDNVAADNLAERYVLGGLGPAEQEAYELHCFECDRCFVELRSLQAIQAALQQHPHAVVSEKKEPRQWLWQGWAIAGTVAASLVAGVLLRHSEAPERVVDREAPPAAVSRVPPLPPVVPEESPAESRADGAVVPSTAPMRVPERRADLLVRLARVEPPRYSSSVLRGIADEATAAFHEGMHSYMAGDFGAAVPPLRNAARLDPARPDIAFFLAVSELLSGDVAAATVAFKRTIDMGETPFREEAHFYLAKAHLKQDDVRGARHELEVVKGLHGALRHDADAILKQLENIDTNH